MQSDVSFCSWWLSFYSGSCESSQVVGCLVAGEWATRSWRPGIRTSTSSAKVRDCSASNWSGKFCPCIARSSGCGLLRAYQYSHATETFFLSWEILIIHASFMGLRWAEVCPRPWHFVFNRICFIWVEFGGFIDCHFHKDAACLHAVEENLISRVLVS